MESNLMNGVVGGTANDPWMETYTGRVIYPLNPTVDQIYIEDIAHQLALQTRYNGCCKEFYSIAEHCWRASYVDPAKHPFEKLMHDSSEAYLGDLIRPLKISRIGEQYKIIEQRMEAVIAMRYGLKFPWPPDVKRVDTILLFTEKRDITNSRNKWYGEESCWRLTETIVPMTWQEAEKRFLERFYELTVLNGPGR